MSRTKFPKPEVLDVIHNEFDRCIATANLLSIANEAYGQELADDTIPNAAFALYQDLRALKANVEKAIENVKKSSAKAVVAS